MLEALGLGGLGSGLRLDTVFYLPGPFTVVPVLVWNSFIQNLARTFKKDCIKWILLRVERVKGV